MTTLVTGVSGFLGQEILKTIIERKNESFILLLREKSFHQFKSTLKDHSHIRLVKGHLQHPDLFVDTRELERAKNEVTKVIHLAALYDLKAAKERLYKTNVIGTQNILFFCEEAKNLKQIVYASTIAVAGNVEGPYSVNDYDLGQDHPNAYARTKFEAEGLVRHFSQRHADVKVDIIRLGVIVGHSQTGEFLKEDGPYYFFKNIGRVLNHVPVLTKLSFVPFPINGDAVFPLVPVDCAAAIFWKNYDQEGQGLNCCYAISKEAPTLKGFLEDFLSHIQMPMKVVPLPGGNLSQRFLKKGLQAIQVPEALSDYLYLKTKFIEDEPTGSSKLRGGEICSYPSYKEAFFAKVQRTYLPNIKSSGNQCEGRL